MVQNSTKLGKEFDSDRTQLKLQKSKYLLSIYYAGYPRLIWRMQLLILYLLF